MINKQTQTSSFHESVMLQEAIKGLDIKPDGRYVDATFGRGGHSKVILDQLSEKGCLLIIDKDPDAIRHAQNVFGHDKRMIICHGSFKDIAKFAEEHKLLPLDGVLFDLGVSSPQLDNAERGFSYTHDGPLDMRMNNESGITAEKWLETATEAKIKEVLKIYGEEKFYAKIAAAIIDTRSNQQKLSRTSDLNRLVLDTCKYYQKNKNPATRTFQAIRIAINDELKDLADVLDNIVELMAIGGRIVFISFQSLEHKIIKSFIREHTAGNEDVDLDSSVMTQRKNPQLKRIGREGVSSKEKEGNRRARSAWMRIVERIQ